jgi:hypothetical protein
MHCRIKNPKGIDHLGDLDVHRRTVLIKNLMKNGALYSAGPATSSCEHGKKFVPQDFLR